jgi:hypothetical protein
MQRYIRAAHLRACWARMQTILDEVRRSRLQSSPAEEAPAIEAAIEGVRRDLVEHEASALGEMFALREKLGWRRSQSNADSCAAPGNAES